MEDKLSIKIEGMPTIFKEDLDSKIEKDVFDEIIRRNSELGQLNMRMLQANILIKGLSDTLIGLMKKSDKMTTSESDELKEPPQGE
tara:strand:- start:249 stop:506 length:258 start_codon:yes stop_codon:yes gene_type:complete